MPSTRFLRSSSGCWVPFGVRTLLGLVILAFPALAFAQSIPPPLRPWVPWVLDGHEAAGPCYRIDGGHTCLWLSHLRVETRSRDLRFTLDVATERSELVPLLGDATAWPTEVTVDGTTALLAARADGSPGVLLPRGQWRVRGRLAAAPDSISVPAGVAIIDLVIDGQPYPQAQVGPDGRLSLRPPTDDAAAIEGIRVQIYRRLQDGIPLKVTSILRIQAFGAPRNVRLGPALLDGTVVNEITSRWPVRVSEGGIIDVQIQSGSDAIQIDGLLVEPRTTVTVPTLSAGMTVAREVWEWVADPKFRSVEASGLTPLDPSAASLPDGWGTGLTFSGTAGNSLNLEEVLRGETTVAPNQLTLNRNLWLDFDGRGYTIVDRISGTLHKDWRLDYRADGGVLGRVTRVADQRDLTVTSTIEGRRGVELRRARLDLQAVIRHDSALSHLDIVGWNHDIQTLSVELNAPPGWSLLATKGVDRPQGTWVSSWSPFELFFLFALVIFTFRVVGPLAALIGLAVLVLAHGHGSGSLLFAWANLLASTALLRTATDSRWRTFLMAHRAVVIVGLLIAVGFFVDDRARAALHPQTLRTPSSAPAGISSVSAGPSSQPVYRGKSKPVSYGAQVATMVQTGPGLQNWSWQQWRLVWLDPVPKDHRVVLYWLPPTWNRGLAGLSAILSIAFTVLLLPIRGRAVAGFAVLLGLLTVAPSSALADEIPSPELLAELKARLLRSQACEGPCLVTPEMSMALRDRKATLIAEVHAQQNTVFRVPGPASVLSVRAVRIDGRTTQRLIRTEAASIYIGVPEGRHRIEIRAQLADQPSLSLRLDHATKPKSLSITGTGWRVQGLTAGRVPNDVLQLIRDTDGARSSKAVRTQRGWFHLERAVTIHVPWRIRTTIRRENATTPDIVRIPLHPDEKVVTEGVRVERGEAIVELPPSVASVAIETQLPMTDGFELIAESGRPWTVTWRVFCSPLWRCRFEGLAPHRSVDDSGVFRPEWKPWPNERMRIHAARPPVAQGATVTIDDVTYEVRPGRRLLSAQLTLDVLSSRGGWHSITLPRNIDVRHLTVDGESFSARPDQGVLSLPLALGRTKLSVAWQQPWSPSIRQRTPAIQLGAPATNIHVRIHREGTRWLLWPFGPRWGPAALFWIRTGLIVGAAILLGWVFPLPLGPLERAVVAFGLSGLDAMVLLFAFLALLLLANRRRHSPQGVITFNGLQVLSILATVSLVVIVAAGILSALLVPVDMRIRGVESTNNLLEWFVDRVDATSLPEVGFVSVPMTTWHVLMLLFVGFVTLRIRTWGRWVLDTLTSEGVWFRRRPPPAAS